MEVLGWPSSDDGSAGNFPLFALLLFLNPGEFYHKKSITFLKRQNAVGKGVEKILSTLPAALSSATPLTLFRISCDKTEGVRSAGFHYYLGAFRLSE